MLDDLSIGNVERIPTDAWVIKGSTTDADAVANAVRDVDAVVHLAALASVLDSVRNPVPSFEINVRGTLTVLQESVAASVGCFVFASSNAAVGEHEPPIDEGLPVRPASPYGASKAAGEAYCAAFSQVHSIRTVSLRFANAYGPHFESKTSVIPKFFRALAQGDPITVYGDGRQSRDFVHVDDVSAAIVGAVLHERAKGLFQVATGVETSVTDLVRLMQETTGIEPLVRHLPQPPGEISKNYSRIDRARKELEYTPTVDVRTGLARTWEWFVASQAHPSSPGLGAGDE